MIEKLTGKDALSARELARRTGISQETLSRWIRDARSLPMMASGRRKQKEWSIDEKIRVLAEARQLTGEEFTAFLEREGLVLAELEHWRLALDEEGRSSKARGLRTGHGRADGMGHCATTETAVEGRVGRAGRRSR